MRLDMRDIAAADANATIIQDDTPAERLGFPIPEVFAFTTDDFIPLFAPSGPQDLDPVGYLQLPGPIEAAAAPALAPAGWASAPTIQAAPAPAPEVEPFSTTVAALAPGPDAVVQVSTQLNWQAA